MPGPHRCQRGPTLKRSRNSSYPAQRLEGVTSNQCAIPSIQKSKMAWGVAWASNHFQGTQAISFVQQACRLRFTDRIAPVQRDLWLRGVQAPITRQETCVSLADGNLRMWQRLMQNVQ